MEIHSIRNEYSLNKLDENSIGHDPVLLFKQWLNEAIDAKADEPTAMILSTIGIEGFPESRVVLLKEIGKDDLTFFTNYKSNKGFQISGNKKVSATFFWARLQRQVRIKGLVSKVNGEISDQYFTSRPEASKIGAWASNQSMEINSREELEEAFNHYKELYKDKEIPRPEHWGGFLIRPISFEFWQGRENRLHDRIFFKFEDNKWTIKRLAP